MHIKQLTISGFKSYREQVVVEPFSPGCNVVVGRNGSGKSNFFSAIRFVLNDAYSKLDSEERSSLLHEGAGQPALSGFVEIVFDNTDNRFPTGRDEVVLRRTIGVKKDEYSLDHKIITYRKTDVMNLLQSAGFSRSNPYYIVPQGRITALCNAKDSDRLALLKEVAGTRVYEEHRAESLKIMEETERKRERIIELLAMIDERLGELDEERSELESFMEVDREKRACEYALWTKQLADANRSIDELSGEEQAILASLADDMKEKSLVESQLAQLQSIEQQLLEERAQLQDSWREKEMAAMERDELLKEITHLELTVSDQQTPDSKLKIDARLGVISNELASCEQRLAAAAESDGRLADRLEELKRSIEGLEARKGSLTAKQSRVSHFKTATERDKWIRQETAALNVTLDLSRRQLATLQEESRSAKVKAADLRAVLEDQQRADDELRRSQADVLAAYKAVKEKRDEVVEARKEGWRAEAKLEQTIKAVGEETERWERTLACTMDRAGFLGLQCIQRMAASCGVQDKVFGPLGELFTCDPVYRQAVETVAGNSLFHVVVEDDDTAVVLMEALVRERAGRLTFVPLSSVAKEGGGGAGPSAADPSTFIPLLGKLQFDPKFAPVMGSVFGRAVVVPELGLWSSASRPADMDLVTLTGDRQSRRGVIVGGYLDVQRSRMEAICKLREWRDRQQTCKQQLVAIRAKLASLEHSLSHLTTQLHILERQQSAQHSATDLDDTLRQLKGAEEMVALKARTTTTVQQRINVMAERIAGLEADLGKPLPSGHAVVDTSVLDAELMQLLARFDQANAERAVSSSHLDQLQCAIAGLKKDRAALFDRLSKASRTAAESTSLERLQLVLTHATARLTSLARAIDEHTDAVRRLEDAAERSQSLITSHSGKSTPLVESFLSRRSHLVQQREDCQKHLRDVGVVSEEAASRYLALLHGQLVEELHKHNGVLRQRFPHVNRRAREQHAQYTKQSEELLSRKADLDASAGSISEFIKSLDTKKDEAILRTFTQVSDAFSAVFSELGGSGRLDIVRDGLNDGDFVGISVRIASFGGDAGPEADGDNPHLLKQLSGGQKSVVALALILAIQMVDPAPFYLFDEVDAALDAAHRGALAKLLGKNKSHQYVLTTFRPELVHAGDQHWGVTGGGAAGSRVDAISKDVALQFIEHV